ncbi:flagellar FliJ protein [Sporobacter termitidis DSM 10068]|uniref:Flagellar FliJ protein n=1 Tax=Sporobacter termitidis DSM 10068 TaxID=1123282 RepID=A0A1M5W9A9_9FIRM|nr:flagellar export protein FliJ [Sporobacter termitidis]SHH83774.1 flagellar FliJ protein [Sporobacter termitidis DSM 10068]
MKKFVFSLNALYDVKKTLRDKLQAEYAAAEAAHRAAVERKESLENTLDEKKEEHEQKAKNGMTVSELLGYDVYFEELQERIKAAALAVDRALQEVNRKRNELVAVFKEIKVLEKLYEKQYGEYLKDLEKSETKAVEDIVSFQITDTKDSEMESAS